MKTTSTTKGQKCVMNWSELLSKSFSSLSDKFVILGSQLKYLILVLNEYFDSWAIKSSNLRSVPLGNFAIKGQIISEVIVYLESNKK